MYESKNPEDLNNDRSTMDNGRNDIEGLSTVYKHPDVRCIVEYIKNKLYFATLTRGRKAARSTSRIRFFDVDDELVYNNFYNDFGPLNIACLYKYCCKLNKMLENPAHKHKQIVHYTSSNEEKRANSAYLIASYAVLYLNKSPREAQSTLFLGNDPHLKPFRDASRGSPIFKIYLLDCLNAIRKASSFGFLNFEDFDLAEYEKYEEMRNGDLNWMVPQKFLAFVGPSTEPGTVYHPPECYIDYFLKNGIVAVVRLNRKSYDASRFTDAGIEHYDMFMPDGTVPPVRILNKFLQLAENTDGAIAIHCKAGLGRTGSLIAAYLIKHYKMTAREAIAWTRICRPGSVIGHQQAWLEKMEKNLLNAGQQYKLKNYGDADAIVHHKRGIYSVAEKMEREVHNPIEGGYDHSCGGCNLLTQKTNEAGFKRILGKIGCVGGTNDAVDAERNAEKHGHRKDGYGHGHAVTQGDRLNEIKLNRCKVSRSSESRKKNYVFCAPETPRSLRKRK